MNVNDEIIVKKLLRDNLDMLNTYNNSLAKYKKNISILRQKNLMSEEVENSSLAFDKKLAAVNSVLSNKFDHKSLSELIPKLPAVINNIDKTNVRLNKYFINKASKSNNTQIKKKPDYVYNTKEKSKVVTPISTEETFQKSNRKKLLFISLIIFVGIGIAIASAIIYDSINAEKSAFEFATNFESIENYQNYLNQYPDGENTEIIDDKFQAFLLEEAVTKNTSESINSLLDHYPNHSALKKITFNSPEEYYSGELKGVNSAIVTINKINGEYSIPEGCRIHIFGESNNKRNVNKYFTVNEDKQIEIDFIDEKQLLIEDNFTDNRNEWKFAKDYNDMTVKINSGFNLYHDNPRSLPFILLNTDLTKIDDYKIELEYSMQRNGNIYLLFAATESAFSFFGFDEKNHNFWVGHHNYKDNDNRWMGWTNNSWRNGNKISNTGKLTILKKGKTIQYFVGDILVDETDYEKYYGNKIGVSINSQAYVTLNNLKVYQYSDEPKINFERNYTYYCSASELKVREHPDLKAEEINRISQGEAVKYIGGKRNEVKAYYFDKPKVDYFYQVELTNGTKVV